MTKSIDVLRDTMIRIANEKGNLMAPEVIAISQELDKLLVLEQKRCQRLKSFVFTTSWQTSIPGLESLLSV